MVNYFLSLSLSQALGVVIFGSILLGSVVVLVTNWMVHLVVQHRIAAPDEFEYRDDMRATARQPVVEVMAHSDDEWRLIDLKSFTCTTCIQQNYCVFAYDSMCTDGDCLANK